MPTPTPRNQLTVNRSINMNIPRSGNERQIKQVSNNLEDLAKVVLSEWIL